MESVEGGLLYNGETWQTLCQSSNEDQYQKWKIMLLVCTFDKIWWKWHFTTKVFLSKTHSSSLIMKKTSLKSQVDLNSTKCLSRSSQNCQTHQKQRISEGNCHSKEEPQETLLLNDVMCVLDGSRDRKWEIWENLNKVRTLVKNNVSRLVHSL